MRQYIIFSFGFFFYSLINVPLHVINYTNYSLHTCAAQFIVNRHICDALVDETFLIRVSNVELTIKCFYLSRKIASLLEWGTFIDTDTDKTIALFVKRK